MSQDATPLYGRAATGTVQHGEPAPDGLQHGAVLPDDTGEHGAPATPGAIPIDRRHYTFGRHRFRADSEHGVAEFVAYPGRNPTGAGQWVTRDHREVHVTACVAIHGVGAASNDPDSAEDAQRGCRPGPELDRRLDGYVIDRRTGEHREFRISRNLMSHRGLKWVEQTPFADLDDADAHRIATALKAMAEDPRTEHRRAYDSTGVLIPEPGADPVFLIPGASGAITAAGRDPALTVEWADDMPDLGDHRYRLGHADADRLRADVRTTLRGLLDLTPGSPAFALAQGAAILWSPARNWSGGGPAFVLAHGDSGQRKSATTSALLGLFAYTPPSAERIPVANLAEGDTSRPNLEWTCYHLRGLPTDLDDAAQAHMSPAAFQSYARFLSTEGRAGATDKRGGKAARTGGTRANRPPRGNNLVSAERLPPDTQNAGSSLARWALVHLEHGAVDTAVLSELQSEDGQAALGRTGEAWVRWLLPRLDEVCDRSHVETEWLRGSVVTHNRAYLAWGRLLATLLAFYDFAVDHGAMPAEARDGWEELTRLVLCQAAAAQGRAMAVNGAGKVVGLDPVHLFAYGYTELLARRERSLSDLRRGEHGQALVPGSPAAGRGPLRFTADLASIGWHYDPRGGPAGDGAPVQRALEWGAYTAVPDDGADRDTGGRRPVFDETAYHPDWPGVVRAVGEFLRREGLVDIAATDDLLLDMLTRGRFARPRDKVSGSWVRRAVRLDVAALRHLAAVYAGHDDDAPRPDPGPAGGGHGGPDAPPPSHGPDGPAAPPDAGGVTDPPARLCGQPRCAADAVAGLFCADHDDATFADAIAAVDRAALATVPPPPDESAPSDDDALPAPPAGAPVTVTVTSTQPAPDAAADTPAAVPKATRRLRQHKPRAVRLAVLDADRLYLADGSTQPHTLQRADLETLLRLARDLELTHLYVHPAGHGTAVDLPAAFPRELRPKSVRAFTAWTGGCQLDEAQRGGVRATLPGAGGVPVYVGLPAFGLGLLPGAVDGWELREVLSRFLDAYKVPHEFTDRAAGTLLMHDVRALSPTKLRAPEEVPEAAGLRYPAHDFAWSRPLDDADRAAGWVHVFDVNAAYPAAAGGALVNVTGGWVHLDRAGARAALSEGLVKRPGYWLLAHPDRLEGLPSIADPMGANGDDPVWASSPVVEFLRERDACPDVVQATIADGSGSRWLDPFSRQHRTALETLAAGPDDDAAVLARRLVKFASNAAVGYLACPAARRELLFRPDWRHAVIGRYRANLARQLAAASAAPFALWRDAVAFVADDPDPRSFAAAVGGLKLSTQRGHLKSEGSAPLPAVLAALDALPAHFSPASRARITVDAVKSADR